MFSIYFSHSVCELVLVDCCPGPQYMLLTECMTHGDLMGFLRATRSFHGMYSMLPGCGGDTPCPQVTSQDLLRIAVQVANGMSFLEDNKVRECIMWDRAHKCMSVCSHAL